MDKDIETALKKLLIEDTTNVNIDSKKVVETLDIIADKLHLQQIYVCENAGSKNHYLYPFVSSKGPKALTMHKNLIVFPENDIINLVNMFKNTPIQVFTNEVSSRRNATAENNLVYGFIDQNICIGFVSFQPYENEEKRIWSEEDKEVLTLLSYAIKPIITNRILYDKYVYEKNIKTSSTSVFWYYPGLSLIIVPEESMQKLMIKNFVYRNAPESIIEEFVIEGYREEITKQIKSLSFENTSINLIFESVHHTFYRLVASVNRFDDNNNPEEVAIFINKLSKEEYEYQKFDEAHKKYQIYREAISRSNLMEFYVDLKNGNVTPFKIIEPFNKLFENNNDFDSLMEEFCNKYIVENNKDAFLKTLNKKFLYNNINQHNNYITLSFQIMLNGKKYTYEATVVLFNQTIYNYCQEVMIFVREVTNIQRLHYDTLTGAYSLTYFIDVLMNKKNHQNERINPTIIFFNFLDFKYLNMSSGLKKGNEILINFVSLLKKSYKTDIVARYINDRFVVCAEIDYNEVYDITTKVINEVLNLGDGYLLKVKAGIYKTCFDDDPQSWIDNAKLACHEIKNDFNTNIKVFDDNLKSKVKKEEYIIENIDKAIENEWIKIYFQPVIDLKTLKVSNFEALTRWNDPIYGFLSPKDFIKILEEKNLIYKLDVYTVNKICELLRKELDLNHKIVPISINLSRVDFITTHPFKEIEKAIKKYNIDRKYICIEITESIAMEDPKLLTLAINKFKNAGYEVWMDDFGSGYSSLNVLKDYPFDEIKIDMLFLKDFTEKNKLIINYTIAMAKKLNIRTLTEGVETKEQVDFLKEAGCERIQGYYFSKPLPYEEVISLMKDKGYF